jgi:polysaccharide biosynthesis protein PslH
MTILLITEVIPFPVFGGEKLRCYGWLKILSEMAEKVIAVIGKTNNKAYKEYHFEKIDFLEFDFRLNRSRYNIIRCLQTFRREKELTRMFEIMLNENHFDAVFIDYNYHGQYIRYFKSKGIPVIYGTHNVQSKIDFQFPSVSFLNKISNTLQYILYAFHEWYYFGKADALIAVSEVDRQYYKKYIPEDKIVVIPNFLMEEDYQIQMRDKKDYVIMSANFAAFQNYTGLSWFVEKVWNHRNFENKKLLLVGIGSDSVLKNLNQVHDCRNIEALGTVDDLKPYIASARVSIVPLLHGSGTRLKCIESMALRTQLLSTSKGAEGIEHEGSIVIADTPELFSKSLTDILEGKIDTTGKAYAIFMNKYSSVPNRAVFKKIIESITG